MSSCTSRVCFNIFSFVFHGSSLYINLEHQEVILHFIIPNLRVINSTNHKQKQHNINISNKLLLFNDQQMRFSKSICSFISEQKNSIQIEIKQRNYYSSSSLSSFSPSSSSSFVRVLLVSSIFTLSSYSLLKKNVLQNIQLLFHLLNLFFRFFFEKYQCDLMQKKEL